MKISQCHPCIYLLLWSLARSFIIFCSVREIKHKVGLNCSAHRSRCGSFYSSGIRLLIAFTKLCIELPYLILNAGKCAKLTLKIYPIKKWLCVCVWSATKETKKKNMEINNNKYSIRTPAYSAQFCVELILAHFSFPFSALRSSYFTRRPKFLRAKNS